MRGVGGRNGRKEVQGNANERSEGCAFGEAAPFHSGRCHPLQTTMSGAESLQGRRCLTACL